MSLGCMYVNTTMTAMVIIIEKFVAGEIKLYRCAVGIVEFKVNEDLVFAADERVRVISKI